MHGSAPLITTLVAALVLAFVFGALANRLRLPPLVGYLVAGVVVGPYTPGFVADQSLGAQLADVGVILLMFGVGLQFSPRDLLSVRALAIPGTIIQIALATLLGASVGLWLGWPIESAVLFGFALSISSTVVLLKALQDRRLIETARGRLTIGWAVAEDLATVLALVLIPVFARLAGGESIVLRDPLAVRLFGAEAGLFGLLAFTVLQIVAFVALMLVVGKRVIPWILHWAAHTGSRELFRLAVLAIALGAALGSASLFGVSLAIGAFFAGMILAESELSQTAAQETLPLRDAFAVLFFVSVGMLFNPSIMVDHPLAVAAVVFIVVAARAAIHVGISSMFGFSLETGFTIAASRSQIGEFSFIIASLGGALGLLPETARDLIIAGALFSIILNSGVFWAFDQIDIRLAERRRGRTVAGIDPAAAREAMTSEIKSAAAGSNDAAGEPPRGTEKAGHAILVGFGRVGRTIAEGLAAAGTPFVVLEDSEVRVDEARKAGHEAIYGNGAQKDALEAANARIARSLLIAIPNSFDAGAIVEKARALNPALRIVVRAQTDPEDEYLKSIGATSVVLTGREIARGMLEKIALP